MWRFLLVVVSLAASARAASESAWAEAIVAARQRVTAGAEDQRPNIQAAAWTDLLRQYRFARPCLPLSLCTLLYLIILI